MAKSNRKRAYTPSQHEDFGPDVVGGKTLRQRLESGELVIGDASQTEGGIITGRMVRKPDSCVIDALHERGFLNSDPNGKTKTQGAIDEGNRRHEAGVWLRILYHEKALMSPGVSCRFDSSGPTCDDADAMPEWVAWNRAVYRETMRAIPKHGALLTDVVCHDDWSKVQHLAEIQRGLSALADHRGM